MTGHKILLLNYSGHNILKQPVEDETGGRKPNFGHPLFTSTFFVEITQPSTEAKKAITLGSTGTSCCRIFSVLSLMPLPSPSLTLLTSSDWGSRVGKWCDRNSLRVTFCQTIRFHCSWAFTVLYLGLKLPNECCYRTHIGWICFQCEIKSLNWQN